MTIRIVFQCQEQNEEEGFHVPFDAEYFCSCGHSRAHDFVVHERPPRGSIAGTFRDALAGKGWHHRFSCYPAGAQISGGGLWSIFSNGQLSVAVVDDLVQLFLVHALVTDSGWVLTSRDPSPSSSQAMFERREVFFAPRNRPKTLPVPVVQSTGRPFPGPFTHKEAFVALSDLRRLGGKFAELWKTR